jgi:hypothetical protein
MNLAEPPICFLILPLLKNCRKKQPVFCGVIAAVDRSVRTFPRSAPEDSQALESAVSPGLSRPLRLQTKLPLQKSNSLLLWYVPLKLKQ